MEIVHVSMARILCQKYKGAFEAEEGRREDGAVKLGMTFVEQASKLYADLRTLSTLQALSIHCDVQ